MKIFATILFVFAGLSLPFLIFASSGNTTGYAWATEAGWINFGCDDCSVNVTNTAITGYAWSQNYGWINFSPTGGGGIANSAGALSGSAWGENTGWIDFDLTAINTESQFTGTASGDVIGTIVFTDCGDGCGVVTTWTSATSVTPKVGSYVPVISTSPIAATIEILIDNGAAKTNSRVTTINLPSVSNATLVQISTSQNFEGVVPEVYEPVKSFTLPPGDGVKTIYVRFLDSIGNILHTVSSTIILDTQLPDIKIKKINESYEAEKDVIISGTLSRASEIIFYFDSQYGLIDSDSRGNWVANLGKLSPGTHRIYLEATDELGNAKTISIDVVVKSPKDSSQTEIVWPSIFEDKGPFSMIPPIVNNIRQGADSLFNFFSSGFIGAPKIITISKNPPPALQGKWNLLSIKPQKP